MTSVVSLIALAAVLLRASPFRSPQPGRFAVWQILLIVFLVFILFSPGFQVPFLHDSYGLVDLASRQTARDVLRLFYAHPVTGDFFFRPFSYTAFWIYAKIGGLSPVRWHLFCIAVHTCNACLVFLVGRRLALPCNGAFIAAMLFAIAGSRVEAVTWVAARVDLFATCLPYSRCCALSPLQALVAASITLYSVQP